MRYYHNSDEQLTKLDPRIGGRRHGAEDPRAVGKPVVWLSNKPQLDQPPTKYQYEVEITEGDPDLFMDEPFAKLQEDFSKQFNVDNDWRWFFCLRELDVIATYGWDESTNVYVRN